MRHIIFYILCFVFTGALAQDEQVIIKTPQKPTAPPVKVFYSQKLINAKTVEVLKKGIMDFSVTHNFGDVSGSNGGLTPSFFGLDVATDIKIGFQVGLSDKFNLMISRSKGDEYRSSVRQLWELGAKWQLMQQLEDDPKHPVSLTLFANAVASSMESAIKFTSQNPGGPDDSSETSFVDFPDRLSHVVQVMLARRFGKVSLQLSPTYVYRSVVQKNFTDEVIDDRSTFAIGAAARIPITKRFFFIMDYFHPFRSQAATDSMGSDLRPNNRRFKFYDPLGVGIEIVTEGHVFHLNFTNSTAILENSVIPRTHTRWLSGQYRWGFTISRSFVLFRSKKKIEPPQAY